MFATTIRTVKFGDHATAGKMWKRLVSRSSLKLRGREIGLSHQQKRGYADALDLSKLKTDNLITRGAKKDKTTKQMHVGLPPKSVRRGNWNHMQMRRWISENEFKESLLDSMKSCNVKGKVFDAKMKELEQCEDVVDLNTTVRRFHGVLNLEHIILVLKKVSILQKTHPHADSSFVLDSIHSCIRGVLEKEKSVEGGLVSVCEYAAKINYPFFHILNDLIRDNISSFSTSSYLQMCQNVVNKENRDLLCEHLESIFQNLPEDIVQKELGDMLKAYNQICESSGGALRLLDFPEKALERFVNGQVPSSHVDILSTICIKTGLLPRHLEKEALYKLCALLVAEDTKTFLRFFSKLVNTKVDPDVYAGLFQHVFDKGRKTNYVHLDINDLANIGVIVDKGDAESPKAGMSDNMKHLLEQLGKQLPLALSSNRLISLECLVNVLYLFNKWGEVPYIGKIVEYSLNKTTSYRKAPEFAKRGFLVNVRNALMLCEAKETGMFEQYFKVAEAINVKDLPLDVFTDMMSLAASRNYRPVDFVKQYILSSKEDGKFARYCSKASHVSILQDLTKSIAKLELNVPMCHLFLNELIARALMQDFDRNDMESMTWLLFDMGSLKMDSALPCFIIFEDTMSDILSEKRSLAKNNASMFLLRQIRKREEKCRSLKSLLDVICDEVHMKVISKEWIFVDSVVLYDGVKVFVEVDDVCQSRDLYTAEPSDKTLFKHQLMEENGMKLLVLNQESPIWNMSREDQLEFLRSSLDNITGGTSLSGIHRGKRVDRASEVLSLDINRQLLDESCLT
eukprot:Nk52_evm12s2192 gene=Nk52_evmTU12s2192